MQKLSSHLHHILSIYIYICFFGEKERIVVNPAWCCRWKKIKDMGKWKWHNRWIAVLYLPRLTPQKTGEKLTGFIEPIPPKPTSGGFGAQKPIHHVLRRILWSRWWPLELPRQRKIQYQDMFPLYGIKTSAFWKFQNSVSFESWPCLLYVWRKPLWSRTTATSLHHYGSTPSTALQCSLGKFYFLW